MIDALRAADGEPVAGAVLAEQFGVTLRTIERDALALQEIGVDVVSRPGPNGGFILASEPELPPLALSLAEATAVAVALAAGLDGPLAGAGLSARRKVLGAMSTLDAAAARRLGSRIRAQQLRAGVTTPTVVLEDAIAAHEVVEIRYRQQDGTVTERVIEPLALVSRGTGTRDQVWEVRAFCRTTDDHRTFRLERVEEASTTGVAAPERQSAGMPDDEPDGPPQLFS